jgi:hypothetical protein
MFGKELLFIIKGSKKTIIFILKILFISEIFRKELQVIIKSIKKAIFYIYKILIKIGNVWERILIYHKKY